MTLSLGGKNLEFVFELPFSWKMFFFSALLFTIASVLYNIFSPLIIRENKSYNDFVENKKNFSHILQYLDNVGITDNWIQKQRINIDDAQSPRDIMQIPEIKGFKKKYLYKQISSKINIYKETYQDKYYFSQDKGLYQEMAFWRLYNYSNICHPFWLYLTSTVYAIGFSLIIIVLSQSILLVIKL